MLFESRIDFRQNQAHRKHWVDQLASLGPAHNVQGATPEAQSEITDFFSSLVAMTRNRILTDLVCNEVHLIPECLQCPYPLTSYQPGSYSVNINAGRVNRGIIGINHLL